MPPGDGKWDLGVIEDGKSWNVSGAWDGENESFDDVSLWDSEEWK